MLATAVGGLDLGLAVALVVTLGLATVIGQRTWGGTTGIEAHQDMVDGEDMRDTGLIIAGAGPAGKMNLLERRFVHQFLLDVVGDAQQNRPRLIGKQGLGRLV